MQHKIQATLAAISSILLLPNVYAGGDACGRAESCGTTTESVEHHCLKRAADGVIILETTKTYNCDYVASRKKWVKDASRKSTKGEIKCGEFVDECGETQYCGPEVPVASCPAE